MAFRNGGGVRWRGLFYQKENLDGFSSLTDTRFFDKCEHYGGEGSPKVLFSLAEFSLGAHRINQAKQSHDMAHKALNSILLLKKEGIATNYNDNDDPEKCVLNPN